MSPCSVSLGKAVLKPSLPAAAALPCGAASSPVPHPRSCTLAPQCWQPGRAASRAGQRHLQLLGPGGGQLPSPSGDGARGAGPVHRGAPAHVLLPPRSKERAWWVLAGRQSGRSVWKHPLSDTPLQLRELPCTSVSPEVRAGLDEILLDPGVVSSLARNPVRVVLAVTQLKEGPTRWCSPAPVPACDAPRSALTRDRYEGETISVASLGLEGSASSSDCCPQCVLNFPQGRAGDEFELASRVSSPDQWEAGESEC